MARKPLTAKQLQKKWNDKLKKAGLSMDVGTTRRVSYIGDSTTLEHIAGQEEMGTRDTAGDRQVTYQGYKELEGS